MVKLLNLLNYDAVMLIFQRARHAGVGLRVPAGEGSYVDQRRVAYCYIETTDYWRIGDLPDSYADTTFLAGDYPIFIYPKGNGNQAFYDLSAYHQQREPVISRMWRSVFGG
ncbi:MAG: hypothetical protein HC880_21035 [Bacteroidia bacterium]|nr:hypothetical protein [Bacteroidia bacterium]